MKASENIPQKTDGPPKPSVFSFYSFPSYTFLCLLQILSRLVQVQLLTDFDHIPVGNLGISAKQLCQSHMISLSDCRKRVSCFDCVIATHVPDALTRFVSSHGYKIIAASSQSKHGLSVRGNQEGTTVLQPSLLRVITIQVRIFSGVLLTYIDMKVYCHAEVSGILDGDQAFLLSVLRSYNVLRNSAFTVNHG